jgi:ADP-ribosylglycohydrolase
LYVINGPFQIVAACIIVAAGISNAKTAQREKCSNDEQLGNFTFIEDEKQETGICSRYGRRQAP